MNPAPALKVNNLTKIYGSGCRDCIEKTGPDHGRNVCPACGSVVACVDITFEMMPGEMLRAVNHGTTMIGIFHDLSVVRELADRVVVMKDNRRVGIGKRADLLVVSERMKLPVVTRTIVGGDVVYAAGGVR